jgi:hypothetical protein
MTLRNDIYEFIIKYIEEHDTSKHSTVKYYLRCARPFWFQNLKSKYSIKTKSHLEAFAYFYEQFKSDNITMNHKEFDLIDYALYYLEDKYKCEDVYNITKYIIGFYFGYNNTYDCALYIVDKNTDNIITAHEFHDMPII